VCLRLGRQMQTQLWPLVKSSLRNTPKRAELHVLPTVDGQGASAPKIKHEPPKHQPNL